MTTSELEGLATRPRSEVVEKEELQTHSDSGSDPDSDSDSDFDTEEAQTRSDSGSDSEEPTHSAGSDSGSEEACGECGKPGSGDWGKIVVDLLTGENVKICWDCHTHFACGICGKMGHLKEDCWHGPGGGHGRGRGRGRGRAGRRGW